MTKVIVKRQPGRPKGSKDKKGKELKTVYRGKKKEAHRIPSVIPELYVGLEQRIKDLQKELEQRNKENNLIEIVPEVTKKPRGRPRRNVEALQSTLDESAVSEVTNLSEDQSVSPGTIINKGIEIEEGSKPKGLADYMEEIADGSIGYTIPGPIFQKEHKLHTPGRPKGSRNKITVALEKIGDENAELIYQKLVELALAGDINACKIIIDRVYPLRKGRKFSMDLDRSVESNNDITDINEFSKKIIDMVADGEISAEEAIDYGRILEQRIKIMTDTEVVKKIESTCQKVEEIKNGR